ncbi:MAG: pantetheine-phosphate adenylyltransferase [Planctomycetota bacterium]|jgi:pantetheine-phosphate adenylyltransferase
MSTSQESAVRTALFPGTFDPVTLGHLDLVARATRLFPRVIVAVASHHSKHHRFDPGERLKLLRACTAEMAGVEVLLLDGLLVEGARRLGAGVIVRGIRSAADLDYERQMALTNRALDPDIETLLLLSAPEHAHVSSTLVRQIASLGGDVTSFVPPPVVEALATS